jgi:predicted phosphodiesterase
MPVAALYDIHGNLPALEAVLADVRAAGVDRIVIGGDVVPGPMPGESLELLLSLDIPTTFITGNGEVAIAAEREGRDSGVPSAYREMMQWVARSLTPHQARAIASWGKTARLAVGSLGDVLFCHATPRNENEIFTARTAEARLVPVFEPAGAAVVICGHTHMQFDRRIGRVRVVNAGSVGMPFGEPGACWLLMEDDVALRRTAYDPEEAAARISATAYPGADAFVERYIRNPPSASTMLDAYASSELSV